MTRCLLVASFSILCLISCAERAEARKPKRVSYNRLVSDVTLQRKALARQYKRATTSRARARVLRKARLAFEAAIVDKLAPRWIGTAWEFSGTSQVPQQGTIACGYFVSTLFRDAGLRVERVKLAQQASERIIKSLTVEKNIRRFSKVSLKSFLERVYAFGDGLYVVGLDYHVGLLSVDGGEGRFIHSSNVGCPTRSAGCVIDEPAGESLALEHSRYRVVGRVSVDPALLVKWLRQTSVPTR